VKGDIFDIVPQSYQRRHGAISSAIGRVLMRASGWRFEGALPDVPKVLIAVAPHTSNWDFVIGVMTLWSLDLKISFLGKHSLFVGPFGTWMRSIGGIAVDRSSNHGVVDRAVQSFGDCEKMVLALAPEGTRRLDKSFKTGFLRIAHGAQVPVLPTYFDFSRKVIGFGTLYETTGDIDRDMDFVVNFFRPIQGKYQKAWQSTH
jgi:1-acyl-sn-glycerol-3-phosphate acyltransferase